MSINKEIDDAINMFNEDKNPEKRAFAYGWIKCMNFLLKNKYLKENDFIG